MLLIASLIAPVFGMIGLGFLIGRLRYLTDGSGRFLSEYSYKVAMPVLLFLTTSAPMTLPASPLLLAGAYLSGMLSMWLIGALVARFILRRPAEDRPAIAMGACFGNGVMLGFPIILSAFGTEAGTAMALLATCETCGLWLLGTLHMEWVRKDAHGSALRTIGGVLWNVATNPIIIGLIAGFLWRELGLVLPAPIEKFMRLVAPSAIPVALIGLGFSLAGYEIKGEAPTVTALSLMRLCIYPALTFVLATQVFALPRVWTGALVIYTATPVGVNAFLFATRYDRAVASISAAVAISTVLATGTLAAVLAVLFTYGIVLAPS